ncbi:hypothetical protein SPRG_02333 [Saprolegnia parasitica CBS 223.65]|uniref:RNA polymerase II subunit A C-terminal domain phosphatase n=1 Tax=Saprolegnia parasitica (strain CBS 223.65) TaxID=695850 RepID=A0A067D0S8_SAPPC|nr:hypothetical protein SPRG_02333 [Saprolegnia parasitica CBS 223.65]KDO32632.1 hypothetical protein SPRG_02333 [Saprolegnia parasitica CBS 223.65]|eukprot:XP_012196300.1 hypothetical protein SPRG_02333 [Saprolegnia parasitica CBS 223.65]
MAAQFLALQCKAHVALSWTCTDGQLVHAEQIIASYGSPSESSFGSIIAPATGTLTILPPPGDDVAPGTDIEIGRIEVCMHPMIKNNRCVVCMSKVEAGETVKVILAQGQIMEVNRATAQELDSENIGRMLKQKKLVLVLDLDHTLLHAVRSQDVVDAINEDALRFYIRDIPDEHVLQLRPGLSTFLSELSSLYDLHIYTHGTRKYAERIAEIIDPDNSLFHHRIVARTDTPDVAHKSLKLLFPSCDDSMIVVLDDRVDVWKENAGNVFIIEAFHHFNTRAEINNASGGAPSTKERKRQDNHLTKALRVLKLVHEKFYHAPGSNSVKAIMEQMRHAVLRGCHVAFSGVIPIGVAPESDYLWKLALSFGAKPSMTMDNFPTTHLVIHPKRLGTKKYLEALAMPSVNVVSPQWLIDCASEWMRLREDRYRIRSLAPATEPTRDETVPVDATRNEDEEETKHVETTNEKDPHEVGDAVAALPLSKLRPLPSKGLLVTAKKAPEDRKSVTFDALPEKIEAPFTSAMRRKRPLPPAPVAAPKPAVAKGVVATGGSFDFLSKMATRKKTAVVKPAMPLKPAMPPAAPARANDDDDDIFRRLMLAEKLEEEDTDTKPKRKFDGTPRPHEKRSKVIAYVSEVADAQEDADMNDDDDDDDDDEDFINALENDL